MKRTLKIFAISAFAAVLLSSCDLDLFPTYAIAYQEDAQMIANATDLTAYEKGVFATFRSIQYDEYSMTEEIQCDGFNATTGYGNRWGGVHRGDKSFTTTDYYVLDFWGANYVAIKNYNILLGAIDNVPESIAAKAKIVKGETAFFRAFSYLNLARHFAKDYDPATAETDLCVPLVLVYNQNEKPSRATVKQVYDQIKADLDTAATLLAGVPGKVRSDVPTIDAVRALQARYYLDIHDYANAYACSDSLIKSKAAYTLANTDSLMKVEFLNDKGSEPILQLFSSKQELPNANYEFTYARSNNDYDTYLADPGYIPSGKLINLYEATDRRLKAWFSNDIPTQIKGTFFNTDPTNPDFYVFTKFWGNPDLQASNIPNARQMIKPLSIAEQYLINAEAALQAGKDATTPLNALQTARGASATAATAANIENEWFKETVGDALRLSCIKRWGHGATARVGQAGAVANNVLQTGENYASKAIAADDFHLLWPMPSRDCQVNPNLAAQQNPGWSAVAEEEGEAE